MTEQTVLTDTSWQEPQLARTQGQYLRVLSYKMPWFLRPPDSTGLQIADFIEFARQKLVEVCRPGDVPVLRGQDVSERRRVLRHICFRVIEESSYMLTHGEKPDIIAERVRRDLQHICTHRELLISHHNHPLHGDPLRARTEERGGQEVQVMAANTEDRKLAEWIKSSALPVWMGALPGLSQKSPNIRLIEYVPGMRRTLRAMIQKYELPPYARFTQEQRSEMLDVIMEEWLKMADQMHIAERAEAVEEDMDLTGILEARPQEVLRQLNVASLLQTREQEEKINPLLQQLVLRLALEKDGLGALEYVSTEWVTAQRRLGISSCDRPSTALATLAVLTRYPDTAVGTVLNRL